MRFYGSCFVIGFILLGAAPVLKCREQTSASNDNIQMPADDFSIKVGVEEVRLDVVVVDNKGRQITSLAADDFELYQDGKRQSITAVKYIANQREIKAHPGPAPALTREEVRRTIVFIVDNLGMDFTQVYRARMAIRKFVETQMLPGDLVAIVPTAGGNAAMQVFTSDKEELLSMAENLRWFMDVRTIRATPQLLAYSYCVKALQRMPGRKYLLLISAQTNTPPTRVMNASREYALARVRASGMPDEGPLSEMYIRAYQAYLSDPNPGYAAYSGAVDRISEAALRAGVVIHSLDIRGVDIAGDVDMFSTRNPLSKRTGGLFVTSNFFTQGIGEVNEYLRGYYLLSYVPPANTFKGGKDVFHRIKIKLARPGGTVHTREGFYAKSAEPEGLASSGDPLVAAMFDPFRHGELTVKLNSGYLQSFPGGYLLQAFLHLDARGLHIVDEKDGRHSLSLEVVGTTLDINGVIHDSGRMQREIRLDNDEISWIKQHGIQCSLTIPSKKPGSYYVRVAVRDKASGKIGSAYRFIEIPDLTNGRLAISSIFTINPEEPASTSKRDASEHSIYHVGETLNYIAYIYNAKGTTPDLEFQSIIYRDGGEVQRTQPEPIDLAGVDDVRRILLRKKMPLENTMEPGNYTLQVIVRYRQDKSRGDVATQTMGFDVIAR